MPGFAKPANQTVKDEKILPHGVNYFLFAKQKLTIFNLNKLQR